MLVNPPWPRIAWQRQWLRTHQAQSDYSFILMVSITSGVPHQGWGLLSWMAPKTLWSQLQKVALSMPVASTVLGLNVSSLPWDLVETLLEVGVETSSDKRLTQTIPTDLCAYLSVQRHHLALVPAVNSSAPQCPDIWWKVRWPQPRWPIMSGLTIVDGKSSSYEVV